MGFLIRQLKNFVDSYPSECSQVGYGPDNCGGIYFEGEKDTPWGKRFAFHKAEVQELAGDSRRDPFFVRGSSGVLQGSLRGYLGRKRL